MAGENLTSDGSEGSFGGEETGSRVEQVVGGRASE